MQRVRPLAEHLSRPRANRIDNEMRVDMLSIRVGGDEHLAVRPSLLRKLPRHLVGQCPGELLLRRKGLDIVVEPNRAVFPVHLPGGKKLLGSQPWCAVLSAYQLTAVLLLGFVFLRYIVRHTVKRSGGLPLVFDKSDGCHQLRSCSASSRSLR